MLRRLYRGLLFVGRLHCGRLFVDGDDAPVTRPPVTGTLTLAPRVTGTLTLAPRVTGSLTLAPRVTGSLSLRPV
jgi:hypothetical protein